jgi:anthranilate synthase/aminodeoxychorismate synthase-like glutamine amidotransferase
MILVLDNYDSFTYNLVQYLQVLTVDVEVHRNDALTIDEVINLDPDAIVISPGPCTPNEAGISIDVVQALGMKVPILGVCLGHQAIGAAHGASIVRAPELMHGKTSPITHNGQGLFDELPNPFDATRYHSLIVERESLPDELDVTAETANGLIMAMQHRTYPLYGVQFHPESILTTVGPELLRNFLDLAKIEVSE